MNTASNVVSIDFVALVDELGLIKAQAAELKSREDAIKAQLTDAGFSVLEGKFFRAAVSICERQPKTDWEAVAAKLAPSRQLIAAHTYAQDSYVAVRVSARKS